MKRIPIDVDELRKVFRIRNGNLERLSMRYRNGKWVSVENKCNIKGYSQIKVNNSSMYYHVIIWILSTGKDIPQGLYIDHINGNRGDSRMENMRLVSIRKNCQNRKEHRDGKLCGCYYFKNYGNYRAQIQICGNIIFLGYYETEQEAHKAYTIACKHITNYVDNKSFRELVKKEMENNNGR